VARIAREACTALVVDTDAHGPDDLITSTRARQVALGAGLSEDEAAAAMENSKELVKAILDRR
jgi:histidinol phosphatase-like PHP family hydrolase